MAKTNSKKSKAKPAAKPAAGKNTKPVKAQGKQKPVAKPATGQNKISLLEKLIEILKQQLKKLKREKSSVRDEYRYNVDTGHVNYVYLVENDGTYHSLGFTHHEEYDGVKNMPLKNNPKKGDTEHSHIRNGEIVGKKQSYSKKKAKNYQLTGDDKANAKSKIRYHKKENKKKRAKKN